jgi:branched-chain amino acid transport system substrate-binding protein
MQKPSTCVSTLLATIGLLLSACGQNNTSNNPDNYIPIGVALAQTSNIALIGQEQVAGAKIAEEYFNQQGGINGKQIKLVFQDTGGDETGAINAFKTLINKNKVVGIVGPTTSQQGFSAHPVAERAKVPAIAPSTIAKGIPEIGDFIARVSPGPDLVVPKSVKAALKLNPKIKKVAVFYAQDQEAMVYETKVFQKTVTQLELDIVTVQKFQTTDTDFQAQATAAINFKPDLAIISGLTTDGGNLVKQLRELGYKGAIVGGNGFSTSNVFPVCKNFCNGILVAQYYNPALPREINKSFAATYRQKYQKDPPQFSAQTFTAVQVFVEALKAVDKQSDITKLPLEQLRTKLNKQILAGKYETPLGDIAFTPTGDIIQKEFSVSKIKMDANGNNGKFSLIK